MIPKKNKLSLNRIIKPGIPVTEFIQLAADTGCSGIELRNDLDDPTIKGAESADTIQQKCNELNVQILTINALQRFNDPSLFEEKKVEISEMIDEALSVGCTQIIMCPVNDPEDKRSTDKQRNDLEAALKVYAPILKSKGITGLIEPLGFPICSVRYKKQAVEAIKSTALEAVYKIVHDTFHHFLSDEKEVFPTHTGLVHVSGVYTEKKKTEIDDEDRILIDEKDLVGNREQISLLLKNGCKAVISYEPFSSVIQKMEISELKDGIIESYNYLFS